jgi:hypothetical protein
MDRIPRVALPMCILPCSFTREVRAVMRRMIQSIGMVTILGGFLAIAASGCGGSGVEEGVPENIDFNKDYTPQVDMPGMSPKIQRESAKKAQAKPATP